jgi:hypothetical protein
LTHNRFAERIFERCRENFYKEKFDFDDYFKTASKYIYGKHGLGIGEKIRYFSAINRAVIYAKDDKEENERNYNEYFENLVLDEQEREEELRREEEEMIQMQFEEEEEEEIQEVLYNKVPFNYEEKRIIPERVDDDYYF